tara:strand:- start:329 stop:511 length:183 start_codon:yes stop_codon:yes gene_type:complete
MDNKNKLEINKRMVGKTVLVLEDTSNWTGVVNEVLDEKTFKIANVKGGSRKVDIFDIRSI